MQEVRAEDYQNRERRNERFFASEKEREEMPTYQKVGLGAVAAVALLGIGHHTGAVRKVASYLDGEARVTYQAFKETMKETESIKNEVMDGKIATLRGRFKDRKKELQERRNVDILQRREYDMQRLLRQREQMIGEVRRNNNGDVIDISGDIGFNIEEGLRFREIMTELRSGQKLKHLGGNADEIENALAKGHTGVLKTGSKGDIHYLLKNHGIANREIVDLVEEVRLKNQNKKFVADGEGLAWVEGMQKKTREMTAKEMQTMTKKNGKYTRKFMGGHEQATVGDILEMHQKGVHKIGEDLKTQIEDVLSHNKDFKNAVFDENLYIKKGSDELFDYEVFSEINRSGVNWAAKTMPGGLLHLRDILNIKQAREQASFRIFSRGTVQPMLNAHRGIENKQPLTEEVMFINGKFVKLFDHEAVNNSEAALKILNPKRDMYLTSSRYGTIGDISRQVGGLMTEDKKRNWFMEAADLGNTSKDAGAVETFSILTKFGKKDWQRNQVNRALKDGIGQLDEYYDLHRYFKRNTQGLTPRTMSHLSEKLPDEWRNYIKEENISFHNQEDVLKLFKKIGADKQEATSGDYNRLYGQLTRNPDEVLGRSLPIGETNVFLGGTARIQTGFNQVEQQLGMEMIRQITKSSGVTKTGVAELSLRNQLKTLHKEGKIHRGELEQSNWLINQYMFEKSGSLVRESEGGFNSINGLLKGMDDSSVAFQESMKSMVKKTNPAWEKYSATVPINQIEDEYIAVNKAFEADTLFGRAKEFVTDFKDKTLQMGLRTGRRNMEDVTTLSIFGSYYPFYRLSDALGNVPFIGGNLGFSDASMGSPGQLISSLMLKRILPTMGAYGAWQYADYEMDKYTGAGFSERWENYKAYGRMDEAQAREDFGTVEHLKRQRLLRPGIEHFEEMPDVTVPVLGWELGPGQVLNTLFNAGTTPAQLNEEDTMNVEETYDDLENGEEAIRKGRWWAFGSKTAYRGGRISEFAPNDYRLANSDWEYTNTTATGQEKYGNSLLPTFENPLGIASFALGMKDPYWYEKKHYYDRPYLLTGSMFNSNTPVLGDIGNATIGELLKPVRQMHTDYWGNPELMQEMADDRGERPKRPVMTEISPGGRINYQVTATPEQYGSESAAPQLNEGGSLNPNAQDTLQRDAENMDASGVDMQYVVTNKVNEKGERTGEQVVLDRSTGDTIYLPARMRGEYATYEEAFQAARAADQRQAGQADSGGGESYLQPTDASASLGGKGETYILPEDSVEYIDEPISPNTVVTKPRGMFAAAHEYQKEVDRRKLQELNDPRSANWQATELASNFLEPHGVWSWAIMDELFGRDPYSGKMTIEKADKATNLSNQFWESELGSLGGSLSEITRRFIRRDSGTMDTYNPVRNTMPDWMPGGNYFINFQSGDPYSLVAHGERRLPGEAYESLNELHPDEFGSYGAFDRLKILADVAPWSEEYKFWRDYTTKYLEDPELRKQAAAIKKQAAKRKKKYEFVDYKFKYAEVDKEKVTVTKFLDDYTFLTKEYGDQAIRLAGVDVRASAPGVLQSYIKPGDKITIGTNADPDKKISNDTYGTMKAVVFRGIESLNKKIIERGEMKESQTDFTATGVWARFSPGEIQDAARWETASHFESAVNTKFLQNRTALEEYERDQIYGKDWATWENFGVSDYLVPAVQRMAGNDNTALATTSGAFVGGFIGRVFLGGSRMTPIGAGVGAATGLVANMFGKSYKHSTGEKWIPERRRKEQEINEYFDILKYMKFSGLYEKAKEELRHMGYDAEEFLTYVEKKTEDTKERRSTLEEEKKRLFIDQPKGWDVRKKEINQELQAISEEKELIDLPEPVAQALYYKDERDATLYAADPYDDRMKLLKAFPTKDKWFVQAFAEAPTRDREKILELVPENQRRIYKAIWGMGEEEVKPLEYYAEKYNLPDADWEGWSPEFDLEDIKVKVVQDAGLDLSDFNYWGDDVEASQYTPDIPQGEYQGAQLGQSNFKGFKETERSIRAVMEGQGLRNVQVIVRPSNGMSTNVRFNYEQDRSKEIDEELRYKMSDYQ